MDFGVSGNCWNVEASGGAICVGCGCCSEDPIERCESRIQVLQERIYDLRKQAEEDDVYFDFEQDSYVHTYRDNGDVKRQIDRCRDMIGYYSECAELLRGNHEPAYA